MQEKDESLLDAAQSPLRSDSITERIDRIRKEIARGEAVYTRQELMRLRAMLDDYEQLLHTMTGG